VPADYDDLLAAIGLRPVLVVAPLLDRYAPVADVRRLVDSARQRGALIDLETPDDFNRWPSATQERVVTWLARRVLSTTNTARPRNHTPSP